MTTPRASAPAPRGSRARTAAFVAVAAIALTLVLTWSFSPLRERVDAQAVVAWGRALARLPAAPLVLIACYVVASFVLMPLTLLAGATLVVFGVWPGAAWALAGGLAAGSVVFALARVVGRDAVHGWIARRHRGGLADLDRLLARRGLVAVALVRLLPLPYSLVNAAAGVSGMRYRDFVAGTALGLLPVLVLLSGVSTRIDAWLAHPSLLEGAALATVVLIALALSLGLRRWAALKAGRDRPRS